VFFTYFICIHFTNEIKFLAKIQADLNDKFIKVRSSDGDKQKSPPDLSGRLYSSCGGDRIRTGVQTYPSKAFYMFIPALIVGKQQETDEPIVSLAEWS
jgi:hypothetical protein